MVLSWYLTALYDKKLINDLSEEFLYMILNNITSFLKFNSFKNLSLNFKDFLIYQYPILTIYQDIMVCLFKSLFISGDQKIIKLKNPLHEELKIMYNEVIMGNI